MNPWLAALFAVIAFQFGYWRGGLYGIKLARKAMITAADDAE